MSPAELLVGLARELEAIEQLVARGRAAWEADELLRLAIERHWITAGNYAERYRLAEQLPVATDPWTELYDYRCLLAHALPEMLDQERVWHDTVGDVRRLRQAIEQHRGRQSR
ncbi:MAG: ribonuclease HepT family protein [Acidimicrobiales bacterium]